MDRCVVFVAGAWASGAKKDLALVHSLCIIAAEGLRFRS